jgi:hypothetical protein
MLFLALAALVSASCFGSAIVLWNRADIRPPQAIRTESGRSVAEHAFRKRVNAYRDGSVACLIAGLVAILIGLGLIVLRAKSHAL